MEEDTHPLTDSDNPLLPSFPPPILPITATSRLSTTNTSRLSAHTTASDPRGAVEDNESNTYPVQAEAPPPYPGTTRPDQAAQQRRQLQELRDLQRALTESELVTRQPARNVSTNRIRALQSDDELRQSYKRQMELSLFLLVMCCLFCNIPAMLCTIPAVIVSWKAFTFTHTFDNINAQNVIKADKLKMAVTILYCSAFVEFVVALLLLIIVVILATLDQSKIICIPCLFNT